MKKKMMFSIFTIIVSIAVIAGGTFAWFTNSAESENVHFTAGTVSIEAGRIIDINDSESGVRRGTFFPDSVYESEQGPDINGDEIKAILGRNDPIVVLNDTDAFFSLGFGGYVIVEFEHAIYAPEIVIVTEVTGGTYPLEQALISVSTTGEDGDWTDVGTATNINRSGNNSITNIPIEDVPYVKFIKIVDNTHMDDFDPMPSGGNSPDGFDLKSIQVTGYYAEEDNWNPGDRNTRIFKITNTGTKAIHLRGSFSGTWYECDEENGVWVESSLDTDVVSIELDDLNDPNWVKVGDWFYYKGNIGGTFPDNDYTSVTLKVKVCLDGEGTDNYYQGARYILNGSFEAIQASNGASAANGWTYIPGTGQE